MRSGSSAGNRPPASSYKKKSRLPNRPVKNEPHGRRKTWLVHPPCYYDDGLKSLGGASYGD